MTRLAFLLCLLPAVALAEPRAVSGHAYWRDGDTAVVAGVAVRLHGLHAPELSEPGGREAKAFMERATAGQVVTCTLTGERTRDRHVGVCRVGEFDLATGLIAAGLGRDCPRYSGGRYARHETPAGRTLPLPSYCWRSERPTP